MVSPKSAVFTTVRARDGKLFHLDQHLERLHRHGQILGIKIPDFVFPNNLDGLVRIQVDQEGYSIDSIPFYQEAHMDAEGLTFPAPRWTRKINGTKHMIGTLTEKSLQKFLKEVQMLDYWFTITALLMVTV